MAESPIDRAAEALGPLWHDEPSERVMARSVFESIDTDGLAGVLVEHSPRPASSPHCACGWRPTLSLNDTESDRRQHRAHQADAVKAHLLGEAP